MDTPLLCSTSSGRGAALTSTCTGSTPQAHAARTCHAKEDGVGVSRHFYGVEAAFCVVVAAHDASVDGRDDTPVQRAGVPRVRKDEDVPRDRALLGGSVCQQQPACRPARCWHWSVMGHGVAALRVGTAAAAAEPGGRRGGAGGGSTGVGAGGPRLLGLLAVGAIALRGGLGRRRCSSAIACGSVGVGRGASARVAEVPPPESWQRRLRQSRPCCCLGLCLGARVEPLAFNVAVASVQG